MTRVDLNEKLLKDYLVNSISRYFGKGQRESSTINRHGNVFYRSRAPHFLNIHRLY